MGTLVHRLLNNPGTISRERGEIRMYLERPQRQIQMDFVEGREGGRLERESR